MQHFLHCNDLSDPVLIARLETDICSINSAKLELTLFSCLVLLAVGIYLWRKYRLRCHKTLLTFHNSRSAVALLLLAINTLELARSLLPTSVLSSTTATSAAMPTSTPSQGNANGDYYGDAHLRNKNDLIWLIIGNGARWNALAAICFTLMLMCYHRIVELKKVAVFLYISATLACLIFVVRIYELAEIVYYESIYELEASLEGVSALCLLALAIIDGFTVYKERYRPEYIEDYEKIGYKHTTATFYSKSCFWWLTPLLWFGYHEPLELEDLGQMRLEDSARAHYDRFLLIYKTTKGRNANEPPSLWHCYIKNSWGMFALGGILKLFGDLFALIGPLAIQQIVQYIEMLYAADTPRGAGAAANVVDNNSNNIIAQQIPQSNGEQRPWQQYNDSHTSNGSRAAAAAALRVAGAASANLYGSVSDISMQRATGSNWLPTHNGPNNAAVAIHAAIKAATATAAVVVATANNVNDDGFNQIGQNGFNVKIYYPTWLDLVTNGWAIAWLVLLAALAQAALSQASTHILNMTGIRIKTSLQGLIYRKTLLLNSSCNKNANQSSKAADDDDDGDGEHEREGGSTVIHQNGVKQQSHGDGDAVVDADNKPKPLAIGKQSQSSQSARQSKPNARDSLPERESCLNDVGAITNLMTEDTLNVMSFFWIAHYVWAIPIKIAVVMYLLYLKLGVSAVVGAFVCILTMTPLQFLIGKAMSQNTELIAKFTDERLKKIHDTLIGIKIIKLNAWDDVFLKKIREARKQELKYLNKDAMYWTLMTILTHISTVLITFVTIAVYVCFGSGATSEFTASRLFSALALFQQMTVPLLIFPITIPIIISAVVSTGRLERFLHEHEIQKQFEGIRNMARILSKSDASLDMYEVPEKSNLTMRTAQAENKLNERLALRIHIPEQPAPLAQSEPITPLLQTEPAGVGCGVAYADDAEKPPVCNCMRECVLKWYEKRESNLVQQRRELLRNTPYVAIRPRKLTLGNVSTVAAERRFQNVRETDSWRRDSLLLKMPDDIAVSINDGHFTWQPGSKRVQLVVNEVAIPKGKLTMVVGKNGSGKTSLLSALLMEMPLVSGNMFWHKTSTISYVPQQPWLLNRSIRENILFGESFRPKRYDYVLEACALKPDIELMPDADFTVIGERGINLSGGQRQRVAIARAIYSSANVVIMDDPLSSLDNEVAHHVFERCIRKMLLKSNRSIILVTQQLALVPQADYLIVMKDGCLHASGSYKDIETAHPDLIAEWNSLMTAMANVKQHNAQQGQSAGRTARERWKLFKNVSKLGLQRSISLTTDAATSSGGVGAPMQANAHDVARDDDDDDMLPGCLPTMNGQLQHAHSHSGSTYSLSRKRSSVYGSRHLIYDVPLPIDECQTEDVIMRRRRGRSASATRRSSSRASNSTWSHRLSGISNASTATTTSASASDSMRRSLLTASLGSQASATSACQVHQQPSTASLPSRAQSWQPQSAVADGKMHQHHHQHQHHHHQHQHQHHHQPVTRNASSPPGLQPVSSTSTVDVRDAVDGAGVSDGEQAGEHEVAAAPLAASSDGGFQQFLRRMSMRRFNKPTAVSIAHRKHHQRPLSATNSILSITEETATPIAASLPSIELSSVASSGAESADDGNGNGTETETDTETAAWLTNIEHEAAIRDADIVNEALTNKVAENFNRSDADKRHDGFFTTAAATATTTTATTRATASARTGGVDMGNNNNSIDTDDIDDSSAVTNRSLSTVTDCAERKYGKISNHIYLLYMRASGLPIIMAFFITALIWQCLRVYTDVWLQHWTDDIQQQQQYNNNNNNNNSADNVDVDGVGVGWQEAVDDDDDGSRTVTFYFCAYATISCICILMAMISTPAGQWAGCNARRNLHDKLLRAIMRKSLHFFQVTPIGRIVNRFSNDMAIIDKKIAATSQRLLQFTLLCLCAVLINVSVTPWFLLLTLPICIAYYAIQKFYRCSSRELQRIENATNSPVISHLSETIQGVTTIRAYNQEARFTEILFKRLEANTIAFTILNTSNRWLGISLDYLGGFIVFVAIVTALLAATISCRQRAHEQQQLSDELAVDNFNQHESRHVMSPSPSPSLVGLAINYTLLVPIYLNWVVKLLADMEMYAGSVERIAYYADADSDNDEDADDNAGVESEAEAEDEAEIDVAERARTTAPNVDVVTASNDDDVVVVIVAADETCASAGAQGVATSKVVGGDEHVEITTSPSTAAAADDDGLNAGGFVGEAVQDALLGSQSTTLIAESESENETKKAKVGKLAAKKRRKHFKTVPISWPQRGDISFENVWLRYEGQRQHVIKNLTLKIPAGQRIGICGRTGSGKSSLALSLFGVLQTTSGRICIDDVDITQIHRDEIRTRLSIIPQDVHLFNATIRENLDPHGYYSDLSLWNCLELAQLKEFVNGQWPMGLDTEIKDGGINLSAGHRQLLCLARAILRGSVCLVLDEATSTLDGATERALLKAAHKAFRGRTIITIAHRLSTILDYDRIIVLENGKIIEDGVPEQLLHQPDSVFSTLLHAGATTTRRKDQATQDIEPVKRK